MVRASKQNFPLEPLVRRLSIDGTACLLPDGLTLLQPVGVAATLRSSEKLLGIGPPNERANAVLWELSSRSEGQGRIAQ
jgi:hypothetical protein